MYKYLVNQNLKYIDKKKVFGFSCFVSREHLNFASTSAEELALETICSNHALRFWFVWACLTVCVCLSVCVCLCVFVCVCLCVMSVCLCQCVCLYVFVYMCACWCMCVYVLCLFVCVCVFVPMCLWVTECICACLCLWVGLYVLWSCDLKWCLAKGESNACVTSYLTRSWDMFLRCMTEIISDYLALVVCCTCPSQGLTWSLWLVYGVE